MNAATDGSCSTPLELIDKLRSSLRACVPNYVPNLPQTAWQWESAVTPYPSVPNCHLAIQNAINS